MELSFAVFDYLNSLAERHRGGNRIKRRRWCRKTLTITVDVTFVQKVEKRFLVKYGIQAKNIESLKYDNRTYLEESNESWRTYLEEFFEEKSGQVIAWFIAWVIVWVIGWVIKHVIMYKINIKNVKKQENRNYYKYKYYVMMTSYQDDVILITKRWY